MRKPGKDDRCTPEALLEVVRRFNRIALDPCSNPWSTVRACRQLMRESGDDGLRTLWDGVLPELPGTRWDRPLLVWVNPPYSRGAIGHWVNKANAEVQFCDLPIEVIMLVPADTSTEWCRTARQSCDAYLELAQRVRFIGPDLRKGHEGEMLSAGAPHASQLIYWGPRGWAFCAHFEALGMPHRRAA